MREVREDVLRRCFKVSCKRLLNWLLKGRKFELSGERICWSRWIFERDTFNWSDEAGYVCDSEVQMDKETLFTEYGSSVVKRWIIEGELNGATDSVEHILISLFSSLYEVESGDIVAIGNRCHFLAFFYCDVIIVSFEHLPAQCIVRLWAFTELDSPDQPQDCRIDYYPQTRPTCATFPLLYEQGRDLEHSLFRGFPAHLMTAG